MPFSPSDFETATRARPHSGTFARYGVGYSLDDLGSSRSTGRIGLGDDNSPIGDTGVSLSDLLAMKAATEAPDSSLNSAGLVAGLTPPAAPASSIYGGGLTPPPAAPTPSIYGGGLTPPPVAPAASSNPLASLLGAAGGLNPLAVVPDTIKAVTGAVSVIAPIFGQTKGEQKAQATTFQQQQALLASQLKLQNAKTATASAGPANAPWSTGKTIAVGAAGAFAGGLALWALSRIAGGGDR